MDAEEFTELMEKPQIVRKKDVGELRDLAHKFPYSQSLQLLYAIRLKDSSEHLFNKQLGRTSILTNDRSVLYDFFENNPLVFPDKKDEDDFRVIQNSGEADIPAPKPSLIAEKEEEKNIKKEKEEKKERKEEEKVSEEEAVAEEDISHLPASERIKAILERNRKLRDEFEKKKESGTGHVDERVKRIREQLDALKKDKKEEVPKTAVPQEEVVKEESKKEEPESKEEHQSVEETKPDPVFTIDDEDELNPPAEEPSVSKPIEANEAHSFSEWLKRIAEDRGDNGMGTANISDGKIGFEKKIELLDSFMEKLPDLKKKSRNPSPKTVHSPVNMNTVNPSEDGALITETLAKVYIKQGHFDKAIKAYQILKLKYPEKSGFFADRILEIKKLVNSK